MDVCSGQRFGGAVTALVMHEARLNIAEKFGEAELVRFYQQIAALDPEMVPPPPSERIAECVPLTTAKDAHVLAAALECKAEYLLTLDRRHLLTGIVLEAGLPVRLLTPGEFLNQVASGSFPTK